jgi:hypothetical protein
MKELSQDSRSPGRDLNPGPPEYKAGVLTTMFGIFMAWFCSLLFQVSILFTKFYPRILNAIK